MAAPDMREVNLRGSLGIGSLTLPSRACRCASQFSPRAPWLPPVFLGKRARTFSVLPFFFSSFFFPSLFITLGFSDSVLKRQSIREVDRLSLLLYKGTSKKFGRSDHHHQLFKQAQFYSALLLNILQYVPQHMHNII